MLTNRRLFLVTAIIFSGLTLSQAQQSSTPSAPVVTASGSAERVRFTAPSNVVRMQLQVFSQDGQVLFDVNSKGNVLDWSLQDSSGQRLFGTYLTVITVKTLSGRVSERIGSVSMVEKQVELQQLDAMRLSVAQQQALGPVEENATLTILKTGEAQAATVVANNGNDGLIIRDHGALSFRLGDFFRGKDTEQMRLTEEGNLGIGTDKPQAKLDVAGVVRTSEGIEFASGTDATGGTKVTKLTTTATGGLQQTLANGTVVPNVAGTGTQNVIAKWTDNSGTLGDSLISESNGNVVVGNTGQTGNIQIFGTAGQDVFAGMGPDVNAGPAFNYGYAGGSFGRGAGFFNVRPDAAATPPNPSLRIATANVQRMIVTNTGDVGIGNLAPGAKLDVTGNINTSTQYNIGGNRILSVAGTSNIFAGEGAGSINTGQDNAFFGPSAGFKNTTGNINSFFGISAGSSNTTGTGNTFIGGGADFSTLNPLNPTGNFDTLLGTSAHVNSGVDNSTAIGYRALVTQSDSIVLGGINGTNGATANTNVGIGTTAPTARLHVVGNEQVNGNLTITAGSGNYIQNTTSPQATSNFNISGNGTAGGTLSGNSVNAATQYNIGGNRVLSVTGTGNTFAGVGAGTVNTSTNNAFFGTDAGLANTLGNNNAFFGKEAGKNNTIGQLNAFFGASAGFHNTTGGTNAFFGGDAGASNTTGTDNTFIGPGADFSTSNPTGNFDTLLGASAKVNSGVNNGTAIGSRALVTQGDSLVLGSINGTNGATANTKVGIGITAPTSVLHIVSDTEQLITASTNWTGGTWVNFANTDPGGGRVWNLISTGSANSEGPGKLVLRDATGGGNVRMAFDTVGNVGIGTVGPLDKLQVTGDIRVGTGTTGCVKDADGTLVAGTCSSDARFKRNITPFPKLLDQLVRLQPVHFYWRTTEYPDKAFGKSQSFGLVAQEVEKVLPELVTEDEKGFKAVRYHELPLMMLQAIKEQQTQIRQQQTEIEKQQAAMAGQRSQIEVLKHLVCLDHPSADVCR
jgi:hypothetical protein